MPHFNNVMLNPQPLPPKTAVVGRNSLNPQPQSPAIIAVLIGLLLPAV